MSIKIEASIARKIGFASHQNAVPLVRELNISNQGDNSLQDLVLTLTTDPAFVETRTWRIDRLNPEDQLNVNDRDIKLNAGYLAGLSESLGAEVVLRLSQGDELLVEQRFPTELLARTEWGGAWCYARIIAGVLYAQRSRYRSCAKGRIRGPATGREERRN